MHRNRFAIILVSLCCATMPVHASETPSAQDSSQEESPKAQERCDTENGEACATVESEGEALERGFDPCLINNSLPACKSDAKSADPGTVGETSSQAAEPDDSG